MPNLVLVPTGSPLTEDQITSAETLVAAALGLDALAQQADLGESGEIGSSGLIGLTRPAVSIQTLFVAGAPATGILTSPWVLDVSGTFRPYLTGGFYGNTYARLPYIVTYTAGWTAASLPPAIREAVLGVAVAQAAAASRVGIAQESMGPVSKTYVQASGSALDDNTMGLLKRWLPMRF